MFALENGHRGEGQGVVRLLAPPLQRLTGGVGKTYVRFSCCFSTNSPEQPPPVVEVSPTPSKLST